MPTEPLPPTVAEIVNAAVDAADPTGADDAVAELQRRFEDRDEPVTAVAETIQEELLEARRIIDLEGDSAPLRAAVAVAIYLAFKPGEIDSDPAELIERAERAEALD
jgi:hypothetical protein